MHYIHYIITCIYVSTCIIDWIEETEMTETEGEMKLRKEKKLRLAKRRERDRAGTNLLDTMFRILYRRCAQILVKVFA